MTHSATESDSMDPYKTLGISRDASPDEIRQAYRRAAAKYHPDAGGDTWVFQQVQQAYQMLRAEFEANSATDSKAESSASNSSRSKHPETPNSQPPPGSNAADTSAATANETTLKDWLFGKPLRLHNETSYFILANFMDIVMTGILLRYSAVEANPIANYFYQRYGFIGMVSLKLASVVLVCVLSQSIAKRSEIKAKILLIGGTLLVAAVVVYSIFLARHLVR
jgi:DnaJ domain/Domain of unknown function (DUF5658)